MIPHGKNLLALNSAESEFQMSTAVLPMAIEVQPAMSFPMGNILARYAKDNPSLAPSAALHERELKRYLYLCAKHREQGWPMVNSLDELWHTFIIFTKDYHEFCRQLGVEYLHHQPVNDGDDTSGVPGDYAKFLQLYRQEFGAPPKSVWPRKLKGSDCGSGCSGGGCSGIGCGSSCGSSCR